MRALLWKFFTTEHLLIGASLMRVSLGVWAIHYYLLHWRVRHLLWGPNGFLPFEKFLETEPQWNVFTLSSSPLYFEALYLAAIAVAVLLVFGHRPRLMTLLHWFVTWSFQERNPFISDGGDNIMRIVLLFLVLVNSGGYFSVDAQMIRRWQPGFRSRVLAIREEFFQPALGIIHNAGLLLIIAQLSLMYMSTGMYKVMGELWQNGTALYYILRVDEFSWPAVAEHLYRNPYFVVGGTYGTVLFELLFAPCIALNRWTRYLMIAAGFAFHVGIAAVMGLITFSWSMLSIYPLLLTDREYRGTIAWIIRHFKLTVFYDGWCPLCTRSISLLRKLDLFSFVHYYSFRQAGIAVTYGVDPERAERRIQGRDAKGRSSEGIDTMIHIALRSPLLWFLLPFLTVGRLLFGQHVYDYIATRRVVLVPGACNEHCAAWRRGAW